ncbi:MAG TPA: GAF domain-containing protein [Gemmatimonas sp.]|nr:GAF domain-containing protein [Gemmatimonas sp.]
MTASIHRSSSGEHDAIAPEATAVDAIAPRPIAAGTAPRELLAVREVASALLRADRAVDVYQFALDRITPILGAAFSVVMQLSDDGTLLRPVAQHDWPAKHRAWIGALRVRVGDGPSGMAVAERRLVDVPDLFADPSLSAWYDVAHELGFASILAAPLIGSKRVLGAIVFYFTDATHVSGEAEALVRLVADQLAATAEKAAAMDALRRANGALAEANAELEKQGVDASRARADQMQFIDALTQELASGLSAASLSGNSPDDALTTASATACAARELVQCELGTIGMIEGEIDPRVPLQDAVSTWRSRARTLPIAIGEPTVLLPVMRTDVRWLQRMLELLIGYAVSQCGSGASGASAVQADVELGRGFVAHRIGWRSSEMPDAPHPSVTIFDIPLAKAIALRLGGELRFDDGSRDDGHADGGHADSERSVTAVFTIDD